MDQLKQAWIYRFWIVIGVVLLLPIIGYFTNTSSLAKTADKRKKELEGEKKQLETIAGAQNPNQTWTDEVGKLKASLDLQVGGAWVQLYRQQYPLMTWPKTKEGIDLRPIFEQAKVKKEPVAANVLIDYQRVAADQYAELYRRAQPVGLAGSKGLVVINRDLIYAYMPRWSATEPPSASDAWRAQENIWILRALLDVINQANQGSTKLQESPVKRVVEMRIGAESGALDDRARSKAKGEQVFAREDDAAPGAAGAATKGHARYVGSPDNKLFWQLPVHMKLIVDQWDPVKQQPRVPAVLAEFGNSPIPMQITQALFFRSDPAEGQALRDIARGAVVKQTPGVILVPKEDEFFHLAELHVWARAYVYRKPDTKAAELAQAQPAAASPTQGEASP